MLPLAAVTTSIFSIVKISSMPLHALKLHLFPVPQTSGKRLDGDVYSGEYSGEWQNNLPQKSRRSTAQRIQQKQLSYRMRWTSHTGRDER